MCLPTDYTIKGAPSLSLILKMVKILQNHYPVSTVNGSALSRWCSNFCSTPVDYHSCLLAGENGRVLSCGCSEGILYNLQGGSLKRSQRSLVCK